MEAVETVVWRQPSHDLVLGMFVHGGENGCSQTSFPRAQYAPLEHSTAAVRGAQWCGSEHEISGNGGSCAEVPGEGEVGWIYFGGPEAFLLGLPCTV